MTFTRIVSTFIRPFLEIMNEQRILEELLALLEAKGVTIRHEPLGGGAGGLCTIKGQHIFFTDTQSSSGDTAVAAAEAVAKIVDIQNIYLRPEIREFIESNGFPAKER